MQIYSKPKMTNEGRARSDRVHWFCPFACLSFQTQSVPCSAAQICTVSPRTSPLTHPSVGSFHPSPINHPPCPHGLSTSPASIHIEVLAWRADLAQRSPMRVLSLSGGCSRSLKRPHSRTRARARSRTTTTKDVLDVRDLLVYRCRLVDRDGRRAGAERFARHGSSGDRVWAGRRADRRGGVVPRRR